MRQWGGHRGGFVAPIAIGVAIVIFGVGFLTRACADDGVGSTANEPSYGWREIYGGVDAARDQWLFYSGMTVAPFSRDIYTGGWRLRFGGGYGQYGYESVSPRTNCGNGVFGSGSFTERCESNDPGKHRRIDVSHSYAEALFGYYLQLGRLTAKVFAGASMSSEQHLNALDPSHNNDGTEFGAKGALEFWLNVNDASWTSLDVSYSSARNETSSRWRVGWRATPAVSIGPELRYDKNVETGDGAWNGRAGLFARYAWTGGEISLAGGAAWWIDEWAPNDPSAYGSLNVLFQY